MVRLLALSTVLGALAGLALSGELQAGAHVVVGAVIGLSAGVVAVATTRHDLPTAAGVLVAAALAAVQGLVLTATALADDGERTDALIGTTVIAIALGLVCFAVVTLLADEGGQEDR